MVILSICPVHRTGVTTVTAVASLAAMWLGALLVFSASSEAICPAPLALQLSVYRSVGVDLRGLSLSDEAAGDAFALREAGAME